MAVTVPVSSDFSVRRSVFKTALQLSERSALVDVMTALTW
ncbi:hypothetical protein A2U01_0008529 [Trifolium medium]|uniref:Uncharacterized protein n=1 Tax=Trifolium medium TaxID=97028 RepID=A0A392MJI0_9FABA|nr:hypothetical protein [Trifolium medium]